MLSVTSFPDLASRFPDDDRSEPKNVFQAFDAPVSISSPQMPSLTSAKRNNSDSAVAGVSDTFADNDSSLHSAKQRHISYEAANSQIAEATPADLPTPDSLSSVKTAWQPVQDSITREFSLPPQYSLASRPVVQQSSESDGIAQKESIEGRAASVHMPTELEPSGNMHNLSTEYPEHNSSPHSQQPIQTGRYKNFDEYIDKAGDRFRCRICKCASRLFRGGRNRSFRSENICS